MIVPHNPGGLDSSRPPAVLHLEFKHVFFLSPRWRCRMTVKYSSPLYNLILPVRIMPYLISRLKCQIRLIIRFRRQWNKEDESFLSRDFINEDIAQPETEKKLSLAGGLMDAGLPGDISSSSGISLTAIDTSFGGDGIVVTAVGGDKSGTRNCCRIANRR